MKFCLWAPFVFLISKIKIQKIKKILTKYEKNDKIRGKLGERDLENLKRSDVSNEILV